MPFLFSSSPYHTPQVPFQEAVAGLFHDDCNGLMAWPESFHIFLFSIISPGPLSSQPKSGDGYWSLCKISILGAFLRNLSSLLSSQSINKIDQ
jgi:hypothetical protein